MKKLFLLLALFSLLCVGCSEPNDPIDTPQDPTEQPDEKPDDGSEIPDDAYITLNKEVLTFVPDGESVEVKVYSNYEWTLTNNCDWVTTSISGGEASEEGTAITLTADLTYDDREGTITFSCGKAKKLLVVSQSFKEAIIANENNTFNLPVEGGTVDIAYQTTVECEVVIPSDAQHWISLAPETRGLESGCATLNIAENNTGAERSTVVKVVKMGDQSVFAEYTITQERNMDYIILYTTTNGETSGPYNFDYLTNTYEDGVGMLAFDGSKVTSIGNLAFYNCDSLTSITIPDSVTSIGDSAFSGCTSLTSITIGKGVTSIGKNAFSGCTGELIVNCNILSPPDGEYGPFYGSRFTRVTIGDSVTSIGVYAFYDCDSLTSVTIGNGVTSIGRDAFSGCTSLTSVTIGNGVTSIGRNAFYDCDSLKSVYITDIAAWCKISFDTYYSNPLYYAGNLYLNNELITDLIIPDGATKIGSYVFYGYDLLTSVTIGNGVTSIGSSAFSGCTSLTSITIPDSVTSIGGSAFRDCTSLTSITIPDSVTSIGGSAFYDCDSLTSVTIPDSVTSIGEKAFYDCDSLTSVTIPDSVTSIGNRAFEYCTSLTSVTIGNGVTSIGFYAFSFCTSLTSVTIPDSVKSIGSEAFDCCDSLASVYITDIAAWCKISFGSYLSNPLCCAGNLYLNNELVTDLIIPDSVTSIGGRAFYNCDSLTSVTIPDSVTSIGDDAFHWCDSLKEVYCKPTTPPTGGNSMFDGNAQGRKIYVPSNSVSAYKSASRWSNYKNYIVGYDF